MAPWWPLMSRQVGVLGANPDPTRFTCSARSSQPCFQPVRVDRNVPANGERCRLCLRTLKKAGEAQETGSLKTGSGKGQYDDDVPVC